MATFSPPTDNFVISAQIADFYGNMPLVKEERLGNKLGRHIKTSPRGRNLFLLTTGVYTENQPYDLSTIDKVYYGGHVTTLTAAEVTSLTNAGYGAYIIA
jgi:hypothetical protein